MGNALDVQECGGKFLNVPDFISRSPASPVHQQALQILDADPVSKPSLRQTPSTTVRCLRNRIQVLADPYKLNRPAGPIVRRKCQGRVQCHGQEGRRYHR